MGWTLPELQTETGVEKRTIHGILREYLNLFKFTSKWVPHGLIEVEKWTRYAICHSVFFISASFIHVDWKLKKMTDSENYFNYQITC